jgi:hydrogenase maturation protease
MKNPLTNLHQPILFAGVGNILKGDDGAGPRIASELALLRKDLAVIDCGDTPENYIRELSSPHTGSIVFIDTTDMRAPAGTVRLFKSEQIEQQGASTHGMSLGMLANYIVTATGCPVYLLGIQPKRMRLGDHMTAEVQNAVKELVETLARMPHSAGSR